MVIAMMSVIGMCALAIDVGSWYQVKRNVQAATDAAALAGASQLPAGQPAATAKAQSEYVKTGKGSDPLTVTVTSDLTSGDSVTVTASRTVSTWFARVLGKNTATITTTSRATIESYTTLTAHQNVMPWAVMQGDYTPGNQYPIYTDNAHNANNGAIQPPYQNGANCPAPSGANDYKDEISGTDNVCPLSVSQLVSVKAGNNTGPTAQGVNSRITSWKTLPQLANTATNPASMLDPSSPQIVLIPVVVNPNGPGWPNGSSTQVKIVGFAWFVITGCGPVGNQSHCANNDGGQVDGIFLNMDMVDTTSVTGAWDGSANSAYTVELTG